jgi:hypothetical protein
LNVIVISLRNLSVPDVAAKNDSQQKVITLTGLLLSMLITSHVDIAQHTALVWIIFTLLTALHLIANFVALRVLLMPTLNRNRARIVLTHALAQPMARHLCIRA